MKKTFMLIFSVILIFTLISCGGEDVCTSHTDADNNLICDTCGTTLMPPECTHTDADTDGKCDGCGKDVPLSPLVLIEDGIASFKFVLASGVSYESRQKLNSYISRLGENDIIVKAVEDKEENLSTYEILIGDVTTRGDEYRVDKYTLGMEGYAVKRIGNKVVINAGSNESMLFAIDAFFSDVLLFGEDVDTAPSDVIYSEDIIEIQDNYNIDSVKVDGIDISGYTISLDTNNFEHKAAATEIQEVLYSYTGYYLPIVSVSEAGENTIKILSSERDGSAGFNVKTNGSGTLVISSAYDTKLLVAVEDFLLYSVKLGKGQINFDTDYFYEYYTSIITYEEYGAKGNGKTDDTKAIKSAHIAANEGGQTVVAKEGATYYIKVCTSAISIRTNVDWKDARFIIDDNFSGVTINNIFAISGDYSSTTVSSSDEIISIFGGLKIDKDTITKLNWGNYGYPALIYPTDNTHRNYIRFGENAGSMYQSELIKVDAEGNIDPDTPFLFDYENISSLLIIRTDEKPLTVQGGIFTTIEKENYEKYLSRGIRVSRSNVTLRGIQHYVEKSDVKTAPYSGFISVEDCDNVRIENSVFTARKYHKIMGTYDLAFNNSNNITLYGCTQSNFFLDNGAFSMDNNAYWGIMASNGCKNITYDTCTLSRFDAHMGLYNGKVINSTINVFELTGGGDFLIENTKIYQIKGRNSVIELRHDYGGTWNGTFTIRNCEVFCISEKSTTLITSPWENHNFGYTCYLPNVIVDGIKFDKELSRVSVFWSSNLDDGTENDTLFDGTPNKNQRVAPSFVKIINSEGFYYVITNCSFFRDVELFGVEKK